MTIRYASLVAWREYVENAKTKGFWLGIFVVPIILFLSVRVPIWLETKGAPVRYFVLVDQSGSLAGVVHTRIERDHQRQVIDALNQYARKNLAAPAQSAATPGVLFLLSQLVAGNSRLLDTFANSGGKEIFLAQLKPYLKPDAPPFQEPVRLLQPVPLPEGIDAHAGLASLAQDLKPYLRGERKATFNGSRVRLSAAILIPADIAQQVVRPDAAATAVSTNLAGIEFWSENLADNKLHDDVEQSVNAEIHRREYLARGLDGAVVRQVERTYAPFTSLNPKKEAGKETVNQIDIIRQWAPSGFVYLLWVSIFSIIQMLLNNIIEEKSNRIIEVLLSSVTPGELMMGKLFGIAATGLTMVGAWMLALFGILSWQSGGASALTGQLLLLLRTSNLVPMFVLYFLLGYVMYAALILALGSVCNTIKEAQSYMGLITMLMMIPLLTLAFIPKDPNGTLARVLSWIPIYTPFTMMNRANADPPLFDLIGTLILLVISSAAALWMAARIFRVGILRTGQPPRLLEMLRWVKG